MKKEKITFHFDKELGIATCYIDENGKKYIGKAYCHLDDMDMMSEKTGCEIAFRKARMRGLKEIRDEQKASLKALKHLYSIMANSKHFNPKSYENKMLQRQIRLYEDDLATTKEIIATEQQMLNDYIEEKDKFYKRIRANREKDENK